MKVHLSLLLVAILEIQFSALVGANPIGNTCPEGHTAFGPKSDIHCYWPSFKDGEELIKGGKNWLDARNYCRDLSKKYPTYSYDLVSLQSEEEYNFMLNTEWSELYKKWKAQFGIWVGLNDRDEEGTWTWSDGSPLDYANPNPTAHTPPWRKGEPYAVGDEDCVRTYGFEGLTDRDCNIKMSFICEGQKVVWSSWSDWSIEDGTKTRSRTCSVEGKCPGDSQEIKKCDSPDCGMCPEGQTAFGKKSAIHCYWPSFKDGEEAIEGGKTWLDARNYCRDLSKKYPKYKYDLVSLQSEDEYNFMLNTEWSELYKKWKAQFGIWVGLNDRDEEGTWTWSDGSPVDYANPNPTAHTPPWRKGEPHAVGDEDCVRTYGFEGLTDRDCNKKMAFICEGQKVMWSSWGDWSVEDGTKTRSRTCFVGKCQGDSQETKKCDSPDCGVCPKGQTAQGASPDIHCYFPSFKDGKDYIGGFNWLDARSYCRDLSNQYPAYSYDLVSLQSDEEYKFILNTEWSELYKKWKAQFGIWVGLNDRDEEGKWTWSDGSSLNYANPNPTAHTPPWRKGEPHAVGDEDCVRTYGFEGLTDRDCNLEMAFICEGKKVVWSSWSDWSVEDGTKFRTRTCSVYGKCSGDIKETKKCNSPDCDMCPEGQTAYGSNSAIHCYWPSFKDGEELIKGGKNWLDARNYCRDLSKKYPTYKYDLVSLQNEDEYNFMLNTEWSELYKKWKAQFGIWVGLNDRDEEGTWTWSDGSSLNYANPNPTAHTPPWRKGEPYAVGDEDCVRTYGFEGLTDRDCNLKMSFICEGQKDSTVHG